VPVGAQQDLLSATMPIRPYIPAQGMPPQPPFPPTAPTPGRHPGLVPQQASPTEQLTQGRARPRPYVVDQPTSPVNAIVPRQTSNSGPVPIAPHPRPVEPARRAENKPSVESETQPHQAAAARKGVA